MQLENKFVVPLPAGQAWTVLIDVERVLGCVPGAVVESVEGDEIHARMTVKLGPITMTYRGVGRFMEVDEAARRVAIEASAKDSTTGGTVSAIVRTSLNDRGDETEVLVVTELTLTGKPAQFGRGAIQEVASRLIDQFATTLSTELLAQRTGNMNPQDGLRPLAAADADDNRTDKSVAAAQSSRPHTTAGSDHLDLIDAMGPVAMQTAAKVGAGILLILGLVALVVRFVTSDK